MLSMWKNGCESAQMQYASAKAYVKLQAKSSERKNQAEGALEQACTIS